MAQNMDTILESLPAFTNTAKNLKHMILANLVMLGEIPAPTFSEAKRQQRLLQRFTECGLQNCSTDEAGNAFGILPGKPAKGGKESNILIVAQSDTPFPAGVDHAITLKADCAVGLGLGCNSVGLATLASLPTLLERLNIQTKCNVIFMGAARTLGRANLEGLRYFLSNNSLPLKAAVCIDGVPLGQITTTSNGTIRGELWCRVPEEYDWTRFGVRSAIVILNEAINEIMKIRLPRRPSTHIILGSIEGGMSFDTIATHAVLRFEIRSESAVMAKEVCESIEEIVAEVSCRPDTDVSLDIFARRKPGGLSFRHPLVRNARRILKTLNIPRQPGIRSSELFEFTNRNIPAIILGITTGESLNEPNETVFIEPMFTGIAQLLGVLLAIDGGFCNAD